MLYKKHIMEGNTIQQLAQTIPQETSTDHQTDTLITAHFTYSESIIQTFPIYSATIKFHLQFSLTPW